MSREVVRIGLLGCGAISQFAHIPALMRADGIAFSAICDGAPDLLQPWALVPVCRACLRIMMSFLRRAKSMQY